MAAHHVESRRAQFRIVNPAEPPSSMEAEGAGPAGPFFPSSAETTAGTIIPANFFLTSESCGRCHTEIYEQWRSSVHHLSSFNNQWYRKSIEYMQDVVGTKPSKWCAGCHDHAVFFNGRFDRPIKEQIDTPEAQAGLACTSCHAVTHVKSTMGQGDFTVEYPPLHDLAVSKQPILQCGPRPTALSRSPAAPRDLPQAVSPRTDAGVLFDLPQGPPRCSGQRLSVVSRLQRLRQLAGVWRVGRGRAIVLLPADAADAARTATCRASTRRIRPQRTGRFGRIDSPPPTRRCHS